MKKKTLLFCEKSYETFEKNLLRATALQKTFKYMLWIDGDKYPYRTKVFYGVMSQNKFRLVVITPGRQFFAPVFRGEFFPKESGTQIQLTIQNSPCMRISHAMVILFCVLSISFFLSGQAVFAIVYTMFIAVIFLIFTILNRHISKKMCGAFLNYVGIHIVI